MKTLILAPEAVEAFKDLFPSYTRAHGLFEIGGTDVRTGKMKGAARTLNTQAPNQTWVEHLAGAPRGLGTIPLLDDGASVRWAAIDIDDNAITLFLFNRFGDLERCALRPGNVHGADDWEGVLKPAVIRYKGRKVRLYFRGDAVFAAPEMYEYLEAEGFLYAIRLAKNQILQESIGHLLTRPVGRPPNHVRRYYASFSYRAGSWDRKRRVVAKVEWHPGELVPRVGFIVTNLSRSAERVVAFYNQRGKTEQYIKEGKNAIKWTRLSCRKFRDNAVRLQLHTLAYNLANFMRTLALPEEVGHWSLTTLREKLVKIGAKVVSHGRYVTFQLAEVAVPRELFRKILVLIDDLRRRPAPA